MDEPLRRSRFVRIDPVYLIPETAELSSTRRCPMSRTRSVPRRPRRSLGREVRDVRVGAMSVEHFIEHLVDGALVIVPGDRPDILAATLAAALSPEMPRLPVSCSPADRG